MDFDWKWCDPRNPGSGSAAKQPDIGTRRKACDQYRRLCGRAFVCIYIYILAWIRMVGAAHARHSPKWLIVMLGPSWWDKVEFRNCAGFHN